MKLQIGDLLLNQAYSGTRQYLGMIVGIRRGGMKAAYYDPNPVVMLEHKGLYWSKVPGTDDAKTIEPDEDYQKELEEIATESVEKAMGIDRAFFDKKLKLDELDIFEYLDAMAYLLNIDIDDLSNEEMDNLITIFNSDLSSVEKKKISNIIKIIYPSIGYTLKWKNKMSGLNNFSYDIRNHVRIYNNMFDDVFLKTTVEQLEKSNAKTLDFFGLTIIVFPVSITLALFLKGSFAPFANPI